MTKLLKYLGGLMLLLVSALMVFANTETKNEVGNMQGIVMYDLVDGKSVFESTFEVVKNGQQGAIEGRKFLSQLTRKHSKGVVLIMVAGMEYAEYVEAKGLGVLESAEMLSKRLIPVLIKSLKL